VLAVVLVLQYAQSVLVPIVIGIFVSYGLARLLAVCSGCASRALSARAWR